MIRWVQEMKRSKTLSQCDRSLKPSTNSQRGYSVLEIIVGMAIVAALTSIAIPKYQELRVTYNVTKAKEQFSAVVRQAKELALAEGAEVYISINGGNTYSIGIDRAPYNLDDEPDEQAFSRTLPVGITAEFFQVVKFNSRGMLRDEWSDNPTWAWANIYLEEQVIGGVQIDPAGSVEHFSYM